MFHGVLDPQPGKLVFALFEDKTLLHQAECIMQPRDASQMPDFVASELAKCGRTLNDVTRWSFGAGPGSFTFLRVVTALGAGWAAGNPDIRFRCLPGALAMAGKLQLAEGESAGILYDGRNKELLCFGVKKSNGILSVTGEELILDSSAALEFFSRNPRKLAAFAADEAALKKLLSDRISFQILEPDLTVFADDPSPFDNDADKMCYIRPAVTTA
jgi:tRNA A37 threonylcarbamoyladenosine modification protein TsaB